MNKILLFVLLLLLPSFLIAQNEKEVKLENNSYEFTNYCQEKFEFDKKVFKKKYKFLFKSLDNVFKNYDKIASFQALNIETELETLSYYNFDVKLKNRKEIEILIDEEGLKKIYKSNYLKIIFNQSLFDYYYLKNYHIKDSLEGFHNECYNYNCLQPVLYIELNEKDLKVEINKCETKYEEYMKIKNQPLNRVKSYFGF